ncbi:MAG: MFS transporter [Alphaproteobacteria bacterium]|nr:MFS transporter [Alphaproteobacteria bacterium]
MAAAAQAPARGSLLALFLVVLTGMIGFGIFIPIFPFLSLHLGGTATETTIAMGAYSFGQLIAAPAWGRLSDSIGRKPVLIAGLIGAGLSYVMIAYAVNVEALGFARLFGGLMAGNVGAAFAAATDLADDQTRTRNMGLLGASFALGFIFGPALAALIAGDHPDAEGFRRVCLTAAAFAMLAAVAATALFRETLPPGARRSAGAPRDGRMSLLLKRPALAQLVCVTLMMIAAQALMETTFGLWSNAQLAWGPRETGFAFAALGLMTVGLQGGGAGWLAKRVGERRMLVGGLALFTGGFAALAAAQTTGHAYAALALLAIGGGAATPALTSLVGAQAGEHERGLVMGLNQSASALGRVIGPAFSGLLFDQLGHSAPFWIGAGVLGCAALVAAYAARRA